MDAIAPTHTDTRAMNNCKLQLHKRMSIKSDAFLCLIDFIRKEKLTLAVSGNESFEENMRIIKPDMNDFN